MKISIIGGGPAGMMAAATIAETNPSAKITIYEKNSKLGRKFIKTGGGRCNITTTITNVRDLMRNYPRGSKWLKYAMYEFGPEQTYKWFEDHGIKLKSEGKRVFPESEDGEQIIDMFMQIFKSAKIHFNTEVNDLNDVDADKIIITTGGKNGYNLAESVGHKITKLAPTLTSFIADVPDLSGVSIQKAKLTFLDYNFTGPILFTHKGLTGPAIFAISAFTAFEDIENKILSIDFIPDINVDQIRNEIQNNPKEKLVKIFQKYIPKSLAELFAPNVNISELSKQQIQQKIIHLKKLQFAIKGRTPGREIVTAGGVDTNEVDQKTMQSKLDPRIYFAGEVLNVDGLTGGFNLQIAWATGRLAGQGALSKIPASRR
jgi:hypothetical protein